MDELAPETLVASFAGNAVYSPVPRAAEILIVT